MKLLKVEGLSYIQNGHHLLSNVNLEIRNKQVTGVIAESHESLDLLLGLLLGSFAESSGTVELNGKKLKALERLKRIGLAQEPGTLIEKMTVIDNIFLSSGRRFSFLGFIKKGERKRRGGEILKKLEALVPLGLLLSDIEPGQRIMIDIARMMAKEPDCYIFNGVTRTMSLRQYNCFVNLITELRDAGNAVLLVPLNVEDVRSLVDRLYFLKNGQLFEIEDCKELSDEDLNDFLLSPGKRHYKAANDPIQRAQEQIEASASVREIDFKDLAESVAMSYDNFRRRFKLKIGVSPHQYFLKMKIEKAKELLLYTDMEIKNISAEVGFPDPYYFSRVFKEREGVSPGQFRISNGNG